MTDAEIKAHAEALNEELRKRYAEDAEFRRVFDEHLRQLGIAVADAPRTLRDMHAEPPVRH